MREIVLDTETTGLHPSAGDKIVEIGCVELIDKVCTGAKFHQYINPGRDVPDEARAIHGLSEEFLSDKPMFAEIADKFIEFFLHITWKIPILIFLPTHINRNKLRI